MTRSCVDSGYSTMRYTESTMSKKRFAANWAKVRPTTNNDLAFKAGQIGYTVESTTIASITGVWFIAQCLGNAPSTVSDLCHCHWNAFRGYIQSPLPWCTRQVFTIRYLILFFLAFFNINKTPLFAFAREQRRARDDACSNLLASK